MKTIGEMDANEILNAIIDSDDNFDWNEYSMESFEDEECKTPNLLDPLSNAEVKPEHFISTTLYNCAVSLIHCHI